jgi:hypothetical protein
MPTSNSAKVDLAAGWWRCPCGGKYGAGHLNDRVPTVVHTMPMCENFRRRELPSFLRWARRNGATAIEPDPIMVPP